MATFRFVLEGTQSSFAFGSIRTRRYRTFSGAVRALLKVIPNAVVTAGEWCDGKRTTARVGAKLVAIIDDIQPDQSPSN